MNVDTIINNNSYWVDTNVINSILNQYREDNIKLDNKFLMIAIFNNCFDGFTKYYNNFDYSTSSLEFVEKNMAYKAFDYYEYLNPEASERELIDYVKRIVNICLEFIENNLVVIEDDVDTNHFHYIYFVCEHTYYHNVPEDTINKLIEFSEYTNVANYVRIIPDNILKLYIDNGKVIELLLYCRKRDIDFFRLLKKFITEDEKIYTFILYNSIEILNVYIKNKDMSFEDNLYADAINYYYDFFEDDDNTIDIVNIYFKIWEVYNVRDEPVHPDILDTIKIKNGDYELLSANTSLLRQLLNRNFLFIFYLEDIDDIIESLDFIGHRKIANSELDILLPLRDEVIRVVKILGLIRSHNFLRICEKGDNTTEFSFMIFSVFPLMRKRAISKKP